MLVHGILTDNSSSAIQQAPLGEIETSTSGRPGRKQSGRQPSSGDTRQRQLRLFTPHNTACETRRKNDGS
jgi:hypothetical protein